jgi:lipid A 4'-phosphatase
LRALLWFSGGFLLLCGGLLLLPGVDLWTSALFYRPGNGFFLGDWPPFRLVHEHLSIAVWAYAVAVAAALVASLALRRAVLGLTPRAAIFLLLSLALGPGLTVNTIFKDHWGRARPAQIEQFGGTEKFTPAFVPSDQCQRNCSFPAGDPAMGFYLVSVALLAGSAPARRNGVIAAVTVGALLGVVRLAQGGHFLSDVIASGFLVGAIAWGLHRLIMTGDHVARGLAALRQPPAGLKQFALLTLACALGFAVAYEWIDLPLARALQNIDAATRAIFNVITRFGEGGVYLVPLGVAFLWAARRGAQRWAWRFGFVFAAVALPGILADIMKPVFGRARPMLLFRDDVFGFTWVGAHANLWSFPSGHSVTVTALAVALTAIYSPAWPAYALLALLVMASRVVLDLHYLSDVIAGAYLGLAVAWTLRAEMQRRGVPLALGGRAPLSDSA